MPTVDTDTGRTAGIGTTFPRIVQPYDVEGTARGDAVPVAALAAGYLDDLNHERAHALRALLVEVVPGDGMSTLVEEVEEAAESVDHPHVVVLHGNSGTDLPEVTEAVGHRRLRAAVREAGLLGQGKGSGRLTTWTLWAAAILLAVLGYLVTAWAKNATPVTNDPGAFLDPALLLVVIVAVTLPIGAKRLWDRIDQRSITRETLAETIREASSGELDALVLRLVEVFATATEPRCVVVDDYATLDECTKRFVREYLRRFGLMDRRPELWVVTENSITHERGALWVDVQAAARRRTRDGLVRTRLYKLQHLTQDQRRHLAEEVGHPERARLQTVRAITAQSVLSYSSVFDEAAMRDPQSRWAYTQLDLIHLLAVTATCGGNIRWREATLVRAFESKRNLRSAVLHCLLPKGALNRSELVPRLAQLRTAFAPVIEAERPNQPASVLVDYEAASALEAGWRDRGLASPGLAHLYWSLHWYEARRRLPEDAFYVDKLARHLLQARLPGEYADLAPHVAGIHQVLFEALDSTIHGCLKTGQLDHVPPLVSKAGMVVRADESPAAETRRRRLLRLAWDVHGVLGDDRVLLTIDEMAAYSEPDPLEGSVPVPPPVDVFEDPFHERSVLGRTQSALSLPDRQALQVVADYGFFQDSWMALALAPLLPDSAASTRDAVESRRDSVAERLRNLLDVRQGEGAGMPALEQVTVSLGLWCRSLSGRDEGLADVLTEAYFLADEVRTARSRLPSEQAVDLVLDGLAEELQLAVATAGLMALARLAQHDDHDEELEEVTRTQLVDLGLWQGTRLEDPIAVSAAGRAVSRRMMLLEVTWRSIGFSYLAAMLGLRRVQLETVVAGSPDEHPPSPGGAWQGLAEELDRPGRRGILAGIVVAAADSTDGPLVGAHLVRVATLARASAMRDDLVSELCVAALSHSHAYAFVDKQPLVDHLAAPGPSGRVRMREVLDRLADDDVDDVTTWLLNSLGLPPDDVVADAVVAAVRERSAAMEPGSRHRDEVESELDVFEIRRTMGSGVDVDAVLGHWAAHRERSAYPFVLYLVLDRAGVHHRDLACEIAHVVTSCPQYMTSSGILLLGQRVVELHWPPEHHDLMSPDDVVAMLAALFPFWDGKLSPTVSQDILSTLLQHEHGDGQLREWYLKRKRHWHEVELELAATTRLPRWLSEGKYAVVLESYWRLLSDYGVLAGTESTTPVSVGGGSADVPPPLVAPGGTQMVNVDFIHEVRTAFVSEAENENVADRRRDLDEAAKRSLLQFFGVLADADDVPASLKSILSRHADLVQRRLTLGDDEHLEVV